MLDCANGYQTENQEEVDKVEENYPREKDVDKEAGAEAENSKEIGQEGSRSEQSCGRKEGLEENDQREGRGRGCQGASEEKSRAEWVGILP